MGGVLKDPPRDNTWSVTESSPDQLRVYYTGDPDTNLAEIELTVLPGSDEARVSFGIEYGIDFSLEEFRHFAWDAVSAAAWNADSPRMQSGSTVGHVKDAGGFIQFLNDKERDIVHIMTWNAGEDFHDGYEISRDVMRQLGSFFAYALNWLQQQQSPN